MQRTKPKRLLSMLLTLCMVLTLLPMTAFATGNVIDKVSITITEPINNKKPNFSTQILGESNYTVSSTSWWFGTTVGGSGSHEMTATHTFAMGNQYTVWIMLRANDGYIFDETTEILLNGNVPSSTQLLDDGDVLDVFYTFTPKPDIDEDGTIKKVDITIVEPVGGHSPDFSTQIPDQSNYTVNSTSWWFGTTVGGSGSHEMTATHTFTMGNQYTVWIMLNANDEYKFDETTEILLNGNVPSSTQLLDDGDVLDVFYTFTPETGYGVTINHTIGSSGSGSSGSGPYHVGDPVTIKANTPASGYTFDKWTTSGEVTLADANASTTTFTMPAGDVTVTANYKISNFKQQPMFTKTSDTEGTITWELWDPSGKTVKLHKYRGGSDPWSALTSFGEVDGQTGLQIKTITKTDVENGTYRLGFKEGGTPSNEFTINWDASSDTTAPTVTTASLSGGEVGIAYSYTLTATGTAPITWSVTDGSLPPGLSLNTTTGVISGSPSAVGNFNFTVTATNAGGSADKMLTIDIVLMATVPGVPTSVTAVAGNGQATVSFTPPANDGGSAITGYTVTSSPGGFTGNGTVSPIIVTGLTNGTPYTFTVVATNSVGNSVASAASNSVTPTAPVTYTVTFNANDGTVTPASGTTGTDGKLSSLPTPTKADHTFDGWFTLATGGTAVDTSTVFTADTTIYAQWTYNGGSSGGSTPVQTVPAANGAVSVNYTASGGTATLTMPTAKVNEIIEKSKDGEAVIDLSKVSGTTAVSLPKAALEAFEDAGLDVTVKLPTGTVTLDPDAAASVANQAAGNLTIELKQAATSVLTDAQKKAVNAGDMVLDINLYSGTKKITDFDGTLTIQVPYTGAQPVAVWYLNDKGELEKLDCTFKDGLVTFTTDHLSLYVVGKDTAWANPFTDVKESAWYYDAVQYAVQNELFNGTSATTFAPNADMTRAMLVTVLYRLEGEPAVTGTNAFTDVNDGQWYTDAVIWANANGIVTGYGNNLFGTDDPITREQMATMLRRYADYKKYDTTKTKDLVVYTDADSVASYALDAMKWANAEGLITGRTATTLAPAGTATRAEVATILMRFAENIVK